MNKIRLFESFCGYGGASFALKEANIPFECVGYSEIDKWAIQCYNQNFPGIRNYGDITKIDPHDLPEYDLFTGGFPCVAYSSIGKRLGEEDPRGRLFYDIIRLNEVKQPKYMLLENVKGLLSKKFESTFNTILSELDRIGYNVYWKVLNSKDYGIPQNRERVYFVCIRKDLNQKFEFPEKEELKLKWQDLKDEPINYIKVNKTPSRDIMRIRCKNITNLPIVGTISLKQDRYPNSGIIDFEDYYRFLTPRECFRLQGFLKDEINIDGLSLIQKYKLVGNGWVITTVSKILKNLLEPSLEKSI